MKRGDVVTVAVQGDYGKPRPALVIQSDLYADHPTVTALLMTGTLVDAPLIRPSVEPDMTNGLRSTTQVMIDKTMTLPRDKIGPVIGRLDRETVQHIDRLLAVFIGIAD